MDQADENIFRTHRRRRRSPASPALRWTAAAVATFLLIGAPSAAASALSARSGRHLPPLRGGSTAAAVAAPDPDGDAEERRRTEAAAALLRWRLNQRHLLHLRSTILSEVLAARGVPVASLPPSAAAGSPAPDGAPAPPPPALTLSSVSTPEGSGRVPLVDFDCALSTVRERRSCLYSFDAQVGTKVVAPVGTGAWIGLSALNRLRRQDPTKVEPMWHGRYGVLGSWFGGSGYSLLQYVGPGGYATSVLLDIGGGALLRGVVAGCLLAAVLVLGPALTVLANRLAVCGPLWAAYPRWSRVVFGPLPLQLMAVQFLWKRAAAAFEKLYGAVRGAIIEAECAALERCVPVTVGEGVVDVAAPWEIDHDSGEDDGDDLLEETEGEERGDEYDDQEASEDEWDSDNSE